MRGDSGGESEKESVIRKEDLANSLEKLGVS